MVNSTRSPSRSWSKPPPSTALLWKKTSWLLSSGLMKPKPLSSRIVLMVPCVMLPSSLRLHSPGLSHDLGHKEAPAPFRHRSTGLEAGGGLCGRKERADDLERSGD